MCGINGIISFKGFEDKKEIFHIARIMLIKSQERGEDATGISLIDSKTDDIFILKQNIPASDFVKLKEMEEAFLSRNYDCVLLHTRQKTQGDPKNNMNNHPIYSKENNNVIIHNGMISNYETLKERFKLTFDAEVDSEIILSLYNKIGMSQLVKDLCGSYTFSIYDKKKIHLFKYSNPLFVSYFPDKELYLFSSQQEYIEKATAYEETVQTLFKRMIYREGFKERMDFEPDNGDHIIFDMDKKTIEKYHLDTTYGTQEYPNNRRDWHNRETSETNSEDMCNCGRCSFDRGDQFIHTGRMLINSKSVRYRMFKKHKKYKPEDFGYYSPDNDGYYEFVYNEVMDSLEEKEEKDDKEAMRLLMYGDNKPGYY